MKSNTILIATCIGLFSLLTFLIGLWMGKNDMTESEIINRMELQTLRDYKRAYLDHVEMCDTLHKHCLRIGSNDVK